MAVSAHSRKFDRQRQPGRCPANGALAPESIGRLLHKARLRAHLSTDELADRTGVDNAEVAAIDVGEPAEVPSTAAFLLDLDHLADLLGVPGGIIEETLAQWARAFAERDRAVREGKIRSDRLFGAGAQAFAPGLHQAPSQEKHLLVPFAGGRPPLRRVETWLCRAVVLVALLLVSSGAALGLVQAGALRTHTSPHEGAFSGRSSATTTPKPLLAPLSTGSLSTSYLSSSGQLSVSSRRLRQT
jgi:transcriptional regulator with XRE-family HTH domain